MSGENGLSYKIRGAIYQTYKVLGPGLLESSYEAVLKYFLEKEGLTVEKQVAVPLFYGDVKLDVGYRIDLLVNKKVIIEIKSVDLIQDVHHKQLLTYLRLSDKKLGLLVNFNTTDILKSIYRKVNGL
jgi:GxxExxY protein